MCSVYVVERVLYLYKLLSLMQDIVSMEGEGIIIWYRKSYGPVFDSDQKLDGREGLGPRVDQKVNLSLDG